MALVLRAAPLVGAACLLAAPAAAQPAVAPAASSVPGAAAPAVPAVPAVPAAPPIRLAGAPALVGEGVVSTALHELSPALAPDGRTLYFTVTDAGFTRMTLVAARREGARWTAPTVLPFSGVWNDGDLALSPDGRRMAFISNRPAEPGGAAKADLDLWIVERGADGAWGAPRRLPAGVNGDVNETYPSLAADGTLYFGRAGGTLHRSRLVDGEYQAPETLPFGGFSIAVAPDQRFVVYGAPGATPQDLDLWVRFAEGDGWSAPRRLAEPVSAAGAADFAGSVTADGRLLFVSTRRAAGAVGWPRATPVRDHAAVVAELGGAVWNGLRNLFEVELGALRPER